MAEDTVKVSLLISTIIRFPSACSSYRSSVVFYSPVSRKDVSFAVNPYFTSEVHPAQLRCSFYLKLISRCVTLTTFDCALFVGLVPLRRFKQIRIFANLFLLVRKTYFLRYSTFFSERLRVIKQRLKQQGAYRRSFTLYCPSR